MMEGPSRKRVTGREKPPAGGNFHISHVIKKNIAMCCQPKFILQKGRVCRSPLSGIPNSSSHFFSDFVYIGREMLAPPCFHVKTVL